MHLLSDRPYVMMEPVHMLFFILASLVFSPFLALQAVKSRQLNAKDSRSGCLMIVYMAGASIFALVEGTGAVFHWLMRHALKADGYHPSAWIGLMGILFFGALVNLFGAYTTYEFYQAAKKKKD